MVNFNRTKLPCRVGRLQVIGWLCLLFIGMQGCAHSTSAKRAELAKGHYQVALTLVHEARDKLSQGASAEVTFKYRKALQEISSALELDKLNFDVHYLAATIYFLGFREHEQAIAHIEQAIALKKKQTRKSYPEASNLYGTILIDAGRPGDAIPHLEEARADLLYVTPYFADKELGVAYFQLGDNAKAVQYLEQAISGHKDLCGAYVNLAEAYERMHNYRKALETSNRFVDHCDTERLRDACGHALLAHAYYRRGMSSLKLGRRDVAVESFRICTERYGEQEIAGSCLRNFNELATIE